jgi:hypothetical protein
VIATNLALLDEEILGFCAENQIHISTSLDGPQDLHNGNRRRPGRDSWEQAVTGIRRAQERLGADQVSALMTTTEASLDRAAEIIDAYAGLGLRGIFLRPISPYGFALRGRGGANYDVGRWIFAQVSCIAGCGALPSGWHGLPRPARGMFEARTRVVTALEELSGSRNRSRFCPALRILLAGSIGQLARCMAPLPLTYRAYARTVPTPER